MEMPTPPPVQRPPMPTLSEAMLTHLRTVITAITLVIILSGIGFIAGQFKEGRQRNLAAQAAQGPSWTASYSPSQVQPQQVGQRRLSAKEWFNLPRTDSSLPAPYDELTADEYATAVGHAQQQPAYWTTNNAKAREFLVDYTVDLVRLYKYANRTGDPASLRVLRLIEAVPEEPAAIAAYYDRLSDLDHVQSFIVAPYNGIIPVAAARRMIANVVPEHSNNLRYLLLDPSAAAGGLTRDEWSTFDQLMQANQPEAAMQFYLDTLEAAGL